MVVHNNIIHAQFAALVNVLRKEYGQPDQPAPGGPGTLENLKRMGFSVYDSEVRNEQEVIRLRSPRYQTWAPAMAPYHIVEVEVEVESVGTRQSVTWSATAGASGFPLP